MYYVVVLFKIVVVV